MTQRRVYGDTRRRAFFWLLGFSFLLHLVLTPLAGLVGLFELWLERPDAVPEGPSERLRELPIELFDDPAPAAAPGALPEQDPVRELDQIIELPVVPPTGSSAAPKPITTEPAKPKPQQPPALATGDGERTAAAEDAGAPPSVRPVASATLPQPSSLPPAASAASEPAPSVSTASPTGPVAEVDEAPPGSAIENPVALAGKSAKLIEKQTSVGLVLYMDRVRTHPLGKRIASLLPRLPQWDEFFGASAVNPVADFDRMFLLGPSFADSSGLVMAIEYNTPQAKIRAAVNGLVQSRGKWVSGAKIPTALTFADRAERVILFPAPNVVVVVPPHLREQAQQQGVFGVPKAKGPEAMVAFTVNPAKAMRRFGLDLPSSLQTAKIRITPLPSSQVLLELEAEDTSAEVAAQTAEVLTRQINATLDLVSGVSNILGRFGFGGLAAGAELPRVTLRAEGKLVKGRQVLSPQQVAFILDRIERQLLRARPASGGVVPKAAPTPPLRSPAPAPPRK